VQQAQKRKTNLIVYLTLLTYHGMRMAICDMVGTSYTWKLRFYVSFKKGLVHPVTRQKQLQEIIALDHVDDEVRKSPLGSYLMFKNNQ
jgi:hypothetical protein